MGTLPRQPSAAVRRVSVQVQALPPGQAQQLFADSRLYPIRFPDAEHLDFVPMSYASYHRSTFLDRRIQPAAPEVYRAALRDLAAHPLPADDIHYIFHSAYCCSTLLASALSELPGMLVLKEPVTLLQLANGMVPRRQLPLVRALLARRNDPAHWVVVKASSSCSVLGAELLEQAPSARALFLYSDLRSFLLAVVKDPSRAGRMRETLARSGTCEALGAWWPDGAPVADVAALDDASLAAWVWIGRLRAFARMQRQAGPQRVAALDGTRVADAPADALDATLAALALPAAPADRARVLAGDVWRRHAKAPSMAYDRDMRERELGELAAVHRPAIALAEDYAHRLLDNGRDPTFEAPRELAGL